MKNIIEIFQKNLQLLFIFIVWVIAALLAGNMAMLVVSPFLILFWYKAFYKELFFGFILILVLSDNIYPDKEEAYMEFSKQFKNAYIVFMFLVFIIDYKKFYVENHLLKVLAPFFIIAIICVFYSPVQFTSIQKTISYIFLAIITPFFFVKCFRDNGTYFVKELLYFLLLLIVVGFLLRFINPEICYSHGGRFRGLFGNPNGLGVFLIVTFVLFTLVDEYFPLLFSNKEKVLFWLIVFYFSYKTGSRSSLLALVLFLIFIKVYKWNAFIGFVTFLVSLLASEYVISNFAVIVTSLNLDKVFRLDTLEEGSGRSVAWKFAWENIQKSILIGKGFAFDENLMRANFKYLSKLGHEGGVHNTYLIIWLNTGLIGLLIFLRAMILLFIKAAKNTAIAIPVLLTILFSINFEPWLASSLNPYTILFFSAITIMTNEEFLNASIEYKSQQLKIPNEKTPQMV